MLLEMQIKDELCKFIDLFHLYVFFCNTLINLLA